MLEKLQAGAFTIRERMALTGQILQAGRTPDGTFTALNDIVVARGSLARVVRLDVSIDESHLATFVADGLVVVEPHRLDRLLVLGRRPDRRPAQPEPRRDADRRLPVRDPARSSCRRTRSSGPGSTDAHEALVSIDGREDRRIEVGDVVEVRALERPMRFVEPAGALPFWDLLRTKVELLPS